MAALRQLDLRRLCNLKRFLSECMASFTEHPSPSPQTFLISLFDDKGNIETGRDRSKPTAASLHSKIKSPQRF
jgi:hypothetical protein